MRLELKTFPWRLFKGLLATTQPWKRWCVPDNQDLPERFGSRGSRYGRGFVEEPTNQVFCQVHSHFAAKPILGITSATSIWCWFTFRRRRAARSTTRRTRCIGRSHIWRWTNWGVRRFLLQRCGILRNFSFQVKEKFGRSACRITSHITLKR